jgi:hypothetical protein
MGESYFMAGFFHTTRIEFLFDLCENVKLKEDARGMQNSQSPKRQKRERESDRDPACAQSDECLTFYNKKKKKKKKSESFFSCSSRPT